MEGILFCFLFHFFFTCWLFASDFSRLLRATADRFSQSHDHLSPARDLPNPAPLVVAPSRNIVSVTDRHGTSRTVTNSSGPCPLGALSVCSRGR